MLNGIAVLMTAVVMLLLPDPVEPMSRFGWMLTVLVIYGTCWCIVAWAEERLEKWRKRDGKQKV